MRDGGRGYWKRVAELTDGLLAHEGSCDASRVCLVLLVPFGLDLTTRAIWKETSDHLEVGAELANSLREPRREGELRSLDRGERKIYIEELVRLVTRPLLGSLTLAPRRRVDHAILSRLVNDLARADVSHVGLRAKRRRVSSATRYNRRAENNSRPAHGRQRAKTRR